MPYQIFTFLSLEPVVKLIYSSWTTIQLIGYIQIWNESLEVKTLKDHNRLQRWAKASTVQCPG